MRLSSYAFLSAATHAVVLAIAASSPGESLDEDDAPIDRDTRERLLRVPAISPVLEIGTHAPESTPELASGEKRRGPARFSPFPSPLSAGDWHAPQPLESLRARIGRDDYGALRVIARVLDDQFVDPSGAFADALFDMTSGHVSTLRLLNEPATASDPLGLWLGGHGGCPKPVHEVRAAILQAPYDGVWFALHGPSFELTMSSARPTPSTASTLAPAAGSEPSTKPSAPSASRANGCEVSGLPAATIERIVRANLPRFDRCVVHAWPSQETTVRFIVDGTGAVESVRAVGPDEAINQCIASMMHTVSFPEPEHGKATVVCPIVLRGPMLPETRGPKQLGWWGPIGGC